MPIKQIIIKHKILFIVILTIIVLVHTIFISHGYTFFFYERLRDVVFSIFAMLMIIYNSIILLKKSQFEILYLIIANLYVLIFVIHLLRLIFGGLPC